MQADCDSGCHNAAQPGKKLAALLCVPCFSSVLCAYCLAFVCLQTVTRASLHTCWLRCKLSCCMVAAMSMSMHEQAGQNVLAVWPYNYSIASPLHDLCCCWCAASPPISFRLCNNTDAACSGNPEGHSGVRT